MSHQSHNLPPLQFEFRHVIRLELDCDIVELLASIFNRPECLPMTEQELKDYFDSKTTETVDALKSVVSAERDEVLAAIKSQGGGLTDEQIKAAVDAHSASVKDQLTALIGSVYDSAANPTGPAPTPTPTPTEPLPTPTGPTSPSGEGVPVPSSVAP